MGKKTNHTNNFLRKMKIIANSLIQILMKEKHPRFRKTVT